MISPDERYSRKELAAFFGRDRKTVYRWELEGLKLIDGRGSIGEVAFFLEQRDAARELGIPTAEFLQRPREIRTKLLELAFARRTRGNVPTCHIAEADSEHATS